MTCPTELKTCEVNLTDFGPSKRKSSYNVNISKYNLLYLKEVSKC